MSDNIVGKLPLDQHEEIFEEICIYYLAKCDEQITPAAVITGGQPGSGKSGITAKAKEFFAKSGGYIIVDADKVRSRHPDFDMLMHEDDKSAADITHPDAGSWARSLCEKAINDHRNLIVDQTSRDSVEFAKLAFALKENGYFIEFGVMAVNPKYSELRIFSRYEEQKARDGFGRFSNKDKHDLAYEGLSNTVKVVERDKLVDLFRIYDKNHNLIFENSLRDGQWEKPSSAAEAFTLERERELTIEELTEISDKYANLLQMISSPERNASKEQVSLMESMKLAADEKLAYVKGLSKYGW